MQTGEEYMVKVESTFGEDKNYKPPIRGRVVYVHPFGRFAALEFTGVNGKFRECFFPEQLTEKNRVTGRRDRH